jgi:hypothetical protein
MSQHAVSVFDARPFFEKALAYGVQHGVLTPQKLEAICTDAPKGMVQIARYFGSEFLRPELERAKDRMVNLISLHLEDTTQGDLHRAAELLRDNSLLSRSKAGSDMLKAMIAMPQSSHFGLAESGGFQDEHIPLLAKWTLRNLPDVQAELAKRAQVAQVLDAAIWLAAQLDMDEDALQEANADAEAVIRTSLLALAAKQTDMPDWPVFEKLLTVLIKKASAPKGLEIALPAKFPAELRAMVEVLRASLVQDLLKIAQSKVPLRKLLQQTPAFMGRYFWREDALAEVDHHARTVSDAWDKATGGHSDEGSLLTLFLTMAAGSAPKTLLTEKTAATLIKKIRKSGLEIELATDFIAEHAPVQYHDDYLALWQDFVEDAQSTLQSDMDYQLHDALSLLRRECNVKA